MSHLSEGDEVVGSGARLCLGRSFVVILASVVVAIAIMSVLVSVTPTWALSEALDEPSATSTYVPGPPLGVRVVPADGGEPADFDAAAIHVRVSAVDETPTSMLAGGVLLVGLGGFTLGASRWRTRRRLEA